jgi:epoxyqueuosine reductase
MGGKTISAISANIQDFISTLDVDAVGVAALSDLKGSKLEETALRLLPETNSIVVFAMEIYPEILDHIKPGRTTGQSSLNDLLDRNDDFLAGRLTKAAYDVTKVSHRNKLKALPLPAAGCPLDARFLEAVFSYKHAGQAAGLGYIGRSSLLITSDFGPRVRLSCCLTQALLKPGKVDTSGGCDSCNICIDNCPARALQRPTAEPYVINKFACASFRNASGGCSDCMRICPAGR